MTRRMAALLLLLSASPVWAADHPADLVGSWFDGMKTVGLTAGTSTLDSAISEVRIALLKINSWEWRAQVKA